MLGFNAVGFTAIGAETAAAAAGPVANVAKIDAIGAMTIGEQSSSGGVVTTTLTASAGTFAVAGQAVTFQSQLVAAVTTFALAGVDASFKSTLLASVSTFAVAAGSATFQASMPVAAGAFAVTGIDAPGVAELVGGTGVFTVSTVPATLLHIEVQVGSRIIGGTWSRGRWNSLQEQKRAAADAKAMAEAQSKKKKYDELLAERAAIQAVHAAEVQRADDLAAQHAKQRQQRGNLGALLSMHTLLRQMTDPQNPAIHAAEVAHQAAVHQAAVQHAAQMSDEKDVMLLLGG